MDICLICLRTDRPIKLSNGLSEFHDELCGFTLLVANTFYCIECEYLLTKFYKFKQKCLRASEIYRDWMSGEIIDPKHDLHKLLPPSSLGVWKVNSKVVTEYSLPATTQPDVCKKKEEKSVDCYSTLQELINNSYIGEVKPGCEPTYSNDCSDDNIQNENDSGNIQETLTTTNYKVVENDRTVLQNKNSSKKKRETPTSKNFKVRKNDNVLAAALKNKNKSKKLQKISTTKNVEAINKDEMYVSMFDIEYLPTHEMKLEEFQRRKTYECYVKAEHKCEICYQVFKSVNYLKYHKDNWHNESPDRICCPICKIWYPKSKRKKHLHNVVFKCKLCPLVTYYRTSMETHFGWHEGKQYHCEECNVTNKSRSAHYFHKGIAHRLPSIICERCGRGFSSPSGLTVHKSKSIQCAVLKKTTVPKKTEVCDAKVNDVRRQRTPADVRQPLCKYSTVLPGYHMSKNRVCKPRNPVRRKPKQSTCRVCNEVGPNFGWLTRHFRREHPNEDMNILYADKKKHLCDVCGTGFSTLYALRDHMNSHTGARPYTCDICSKQFPYSVGLHDHRLRHFPATKSCTHCDRKFKTRSNLYAHMKVHTGERSYRCNICGKGFLLSTSLNEHIKGVHLHIRRARKRDAETDEGAKNLSKKRNKILRIEAIETSEVLETETIDASEILETETIDASEILDTETIDTSEVFETETIDASKVFEAETIDSNSSEIFEIETLDSSEEFETETLDL